MNLFFRVALSLITAPVLIFSGAICASVIPILIGQFLSNDVVGAAMILACVLGFAAAGIVGTILHRWMLFGFYTAIICITVLAAAITYNSVFRLGEYHLARIVDIDVTAIDSPRDVLIRPLPYWVDSDNAKFAQESLHKTKYSQHVCNRPYIIPLCSQEYGCQPNIWIAGDAGANLSPSTDCSDLPIPDWQAITRTQWLRLIHDTDTYEHIRDLGENPKVYTPTTEPLTSPFALLQELKKGLLPSITFIGSLLVIEVLVMSRKIIKNEPWPDI